MISVEPTNDASIAVPLPKVAVDQLLPDPKNGDLGTVIFSSMGGIPGAGFDDSVVELLDKHI